MSLLEHAAQLQAFRSNVEDLALAEITILEERQKQLTTELESVLYQLKSVRAVLRASTNGSGPKPKAKPKPSQPFKLTGEREVAVMAFLEGNEDEITSRSFKAQFPAWSTAYCNSVLKHLRDEGTIRLSGTSGQMNIYRSMV